MNHAAHSAKQKRFAGLNSPNVFEKILHVAFMLKHGLQILMMRPKAALR
jgi:hypothetical protein